jgi:hypothetical protein
MKLIHELFIGLFDAFGGAQTYWSRGIWVGFGVVVNVGGK